MRKATRTTRALFSRDRSEARGLMRNGARFSSRPACFAHGEKHGYYADYGGTEFSPRYSRRFAYVNKYRLTAGGATELPSPGAAKQFVVCSRITTRSAIERMAALIWRDLIREHETRGRHCPSFAFLCRCSYGRGVMAKKRRSILLRPHRPALAEALRKGGAKICGVS